MPAWMLVPDCPAGMPECHLQTDRVNRSLQKNKTRSYTVFIQSDRHLPSFTSTSRHSPPAFTRPCSPAFASICQYLPVLPSIYQHLPAFTSMCQHLPAFISIRQHLPAFASIHKHVPAFVSIHKHVPAFVSICKHLPGFASICQHLPALASIRQHYSQQPLADGVNRSLQKNIKTKLHRLYL